MSSVTFDVTQFRAQYPAFASETDFPDAVLQGNWDLATCYMTPENYGILQGTCRQKALNMLTAHITALSTQYNVGEITGVLQNATIDKVTVGMYSPPIKNSWDYWLYQTPYGQQLIALLRALSVGGMYLGSVPELAAFRRVAGVFVP